MIMDQIMHDPLNTKIAITTLYLWLLFGYQSSLLSTDLQQRIHTNKVYRHLAGLISFFFLFALLDAQNKEHVGMIFVKVVIIYILFLMITTVKWYFAGLVMLVLVIDQVLRMHIRYLEDNKLPTQDFVNIREWCTVVMFGLIVCGFLYQRYVEK